MVAIKAAELPGLLKSSGTKTDAYLIHGTDVGQVAEIAGSLAKQLAALSKPPGEIIRLSEQDLAQAPGRLASEARSLAMFGGRPVLLVKPGPQLTPALFEDLLGGPPLAAFIIVEAGNLKKDAKLRQIFEKAKSAAAIVCYGADNRSLQQLIRDEVEKAGLTIAADAAQRLTQLIGADWAVSRAEIAKLTLYALGETQITLAHVEAVVGDASAHAFDAAISETLAGNAAAALAQLDALAGSGTPAQVLLNLLSGHLQKLHAVLAAVDRGDSFDAAAGRLRPSPHFRQKDEMKAQTARWRLPEVAAAIEAVHETIRQTRLKPALEHELAAALILRMPEINPRLTKSRAA
ncbi:MULTISPECIES: DNA polymerase III subunit delta [Rhodomicrobium]|uniref:DNA polymerase III subunit delta n=1 Tax=Rhodomicrobium TaxID=1068 RepID=UPI000B4BD2B7|nr:MULTISPECIES: DNA polymerase III subunit delta [Rhodomicrobium]